MQQLRASTFGLTLPQLSDAILDIIDQLTRAGYDAYIVGGGVRDLLLGLHPKDFDAVTNATPAQIKQVFGKRCRIIGRRFELAHVYSGRDMIEVATFRAPPRKVIATQAGMIMRDNVWGNIQQDFSRRDISINTLYYQPFKDKILDFCNAIDDVKAKKICFLGDTLTRVQEDPVRMMRVLRFAAKLQFNLDDACKQVLVPANTQLLKEVSSHRLFDEVQKMFMGGYLLPLMHKLAKYHVWQHLFACPAHMTPFITLAAQNTDKRIGSGKTVNPAFFYAVLLWEPFLAQVNRLIAQNVAPALAWTQAGLLVLAQQEQFTAIPRFAQNFIREVWELQPRLIQPKSRQVPMLAMHPRFRAGFDFLYLREQIGDATTQGMGAWWHDYQHLDNDSRELAMAALNKQQLAQKKQKQKNAQPTATAEMQPSVLETIANSKLETNAYGEIELISALDEKPKRRRNRDKSRFDATTNSAGRNNNNADNESSNDDAFYAVKDEREPHTKQAYAGQRGRVRRQRRERDLSLVDMGPTAPTARKPRLN